MAVEGFSLTGGFSFGGMSPLVKGIIVFGTVIVTVVIVMFIILFIMAKLKFKLRIVLFKKVGENWIKDVKIPKLNCTDLGCFERISKAGDFWLKTRKLKKILPRPKIQAGINEFWYAERLDGEWINIGLEDIDDKMKKARVKYVDEDMRFHRLGIEKNLEKRLGLKTWLEKYGTIIGIAIFFILITLLQVVQFHEARKTMAETSSIGENLDRIATKVSTMLDSAENIQKRQSGGAIEVTSLFLPFIRRRKKCRHISKE